MDFDFSQEQYMFRDTTRTFLKQSYGLDRAQRQANGFDGAFWDEIVETGAFSMLVPEAFGGMGLSFVDLALVLEEYGRALIPSLVLETLAATDVLVQFGTEEQKARLLPLIAEGKLKIASASCEGDAGYDPDSVAASAMRSGDNWVLSGRKVLVPEAAEADLILVIARFGEKGTLGLAVVENDRQGIGFQQQPTFDVLGRYHALTLENVCVTPDDIVGGSPDPAAVERLLDASRVVAATIMTGISGLILDKSVEYAGQREQFGRPIGSFQAIKHRCADMAVLLDASRSAAYYAAWALAEDGQDRAKAVSLAKAYCGEAARDICNQGIQLHGGIGFTWELGLHFYLRRTKMLEHAYGDVAYHRERVMSCALAELGIPHDEHQQDL
jgi:alkylation response protein AidB-like acyl-CoA dehydrogenase